MNCDVHGALGRVACDVGSKQDTPHIACTNHHITQNDAIKIQQIHNALPTHAKINTHICKPRRKNSQVDRTSPPHDTTPNPKTHPHVRAFRIAVHTQHMHSKPSPSQHQRPQAIPSGACLATHIDDVARSATSRATSDQNMTFRTFLTRPSLWTLASNGTIMQAKSLYQSLNSSSLSLNTHDCI